MVQYQIWDYICGIDNDYSDEINLEFIWYTDPETNDTGKTCSEWAAEYKLKDNKDIDYQGNTKYSKTCANCYSYLSDVYKAMNDIQTIDFNTYAPYLRKVTDHWFRNVYFTYSAAAETDTNGDGIMDSSSIIINDNDYEKQTGERWTLYETYSDVTGRVSDASEYKLYVYKPDDNGNYTGEFYKIGDEYVLCKYVGEGKGNYRQSDNGTTFEQSSNGDYKLVMNNSNYSDYTGEELKEFRVGKKAKTESIDSHWSAYSSEIEVNESGWKTLDTSDSTLLTRLVTNAPNTEPVYKARKGVVTQVEDGIRGETNPDIKKIFLDDYYLYDGSTSRAALIEAAKKKAGSDDPDDYRSQFGDEVIEADYYVTSKPSKEADDSEYTTELKGHYTATIDEISGPISLTHNSLSAFSILENLHTEDAEYIYHDFKELIVELNYFNKEDLVESEDSVMMFPIRGGSSAGWPDSEYDKSENFYGTLIHSAEDYSYKRAKSLEELAELLKYENEETNDDNSENETETEEVNSTVEEDTTETTNTTTTTTDASSNLLVQAASDIMTYMQANSYTYSQSLRASSFEESKQDGHHFVDCSGFVSWCLQEVGIFDKGEMTWSGGISTLSKLVDYYTSGNKGDYSNYEPGTIMIYDGHVSLYAGPELGFYDAGSTNCINKSPRDISGWHAPSTVKGYIYIPNDKMTYNGVKGSATSTTSSGSDVDYAGYQGGETVVAPVTGEVLKYGIVERTNLERENSSEENEQDNTVAPKTEKVGFIKIKVLDQGVPSQTCTYFLKGARQNINLSSSEDIKDIDVEDKVKNAYTEEQLKSLGYDYYWEEYNDAGITGHVLYIEGFKIPDGVSVEENDEAEVSTNIQNLQSFIMRDDTPNEYKTQYEVPNLLDDKRELELYVAEKAKDLADYSITAQDGKIYIKEGAVIGYTFTKDEAIEAGLTQEKESLATPDETNTADSDTSGNATNINSDGTSATQIYNVGNYLRIIFRDTDDEVVENVEDFIEVDETESASTNLTDDIFVKYLMSYECGAVYNYLYGDTSYNSGLTKYVTEDKKNYIVYNDGLGRDDRNFGPGVLHFYNNAWQNVEAYNQVGVNIRQEQFKQIGVGQLDVNLVNQVMLIEINGKRESVRSLIGDDRWNKLPKNQQDLLVDIAYQGWGGYSIQSLKDAIDGGNLSSWGRITQTTYNNQQRADARYKLCTEGIYIDSSGNEITGGDNIIDEIGGGQNAEE